MLTGKLVLVICIVLIFQQRTHGDGDTLVVDVDVNDLDLDCIADRNDILYIFNTLVSQLRYVDQTVYAVNDLCKCTERSDGNDGCVDHIANSIVCLELLPRIVFLLLVAQGNAVA